LILGKSGDNSIGGRTDDNKSSSLLNQPKKADESDYDDDWGEEDEKQ